MTRLVTTDHSEKEGHVREDRLLLYVDGELSGAEAGRLHSHLDACWSCRLRAEQIQQAISTFVDYRNHIVAPIISRPPGGGRGFYPKLARVAAEGGRRSLISLSVGWFARLLLPADVLLRPAMGFILVAVFAIASGGAWYLSKQSSKPLSAESILKQSVAAEKLSLAVPGKVVRRTINLEERKPSTGEIIARHRIEAWQDGSKKMRATRVYSANGKLEAGEWQKADSPHIVYQKAKLSSASSKPLNRLEDDAIWQLLPSVENFESVTGHPDNITVEERSAVYVLLYQNRRTADGPRLVNASLTLRRADLHAIEQTIQIEQDGGRIKDYRLVEIAFEQWQANSVSASVFQPDRELVAKARLKPEADNPQPLFVPATADFEVEVLNRLDGIGALIKDQVKVRHTQRGALLIEGVVESDQRKAEILHALGTAERSPAVKLALTTTADAQAQRLKTLSGPLLVESVEIEQGKSAVDEDIRKHFIYAELTGVELDAEVARFSNDILDRSSQLQAHAMVLRRVVGNIPVSEVEALSPEATRQWRALVNRHSQAMEEEIRALRKVLTPIFNYPSANCEMRTRVDLNADIARLTDMALSCDTVMWNSFSATKQELTAQTVRTENFWRLLDAAETLASAVRSETK